MEMYLSTILAYMALYFQRKEGTLILLPSAAILQSVMLHLEHFAVFFFQVTDSILDFDILRNFSLRYVLFHYFRLGYQFYVAILRDINYYASRIEIEFLSSREWLF